MAYQYGNEKEGTWRERNRTGLDPGYAAGCMTVPLTVLVVKSKEGQRPALNVCSSSSGTVLNEYVERETRNTN